MRSPREIPWASVRSAAIRGRGRWAPRRTLTRSRSRDLDGGPPLAAFAIEERDLCARPHRWHAVSGWLRSSPVQDSISFASMARAQCRRPTPVLGAVRGRARHPILSDSAPEPTLPLSPRWPETPKRLAT
jgi:hypothetical protein